MRAHGVAACTHDRPGGEGLAARLMLHLPYYVSLQFPNFLQCELDDGSMYELMILSPNLEETGGGFERPTSRPEWDCQ